MQAQAAEKAGQFMDCFLPMPIVDENGLSEDCWGAQEVGPRDQSNGLEDPLIGVEGAEGTRYCYWDGAIIKDDVTGKYYMFASKWKESDGHWGWPGSQAVYATSDNLYGPYEEQGLMWPEYENSYGHNVFPFELKDGEMFNGRKCAMPLSWATPTETVFRAVSLFPTAWMDRGILPARWRSIRMRR